MHCHANFEPPFLKDLNAMKCFGVCCRWQDELLLLGDWCCWAWDESAVPRYKLCTDKHFCTFYFPLGWDSLHILYSFVCMEWALLVFRQLMHTTRRWYNAANLVKLCNVVSLWRVAAYHGIGHPSISPLGSCLCFSVCLPPPSLSKPSGHRKSRRQGSLIL